jgi:UDP-glucose 4-epimerase
MKKILITGGAGFIGSSFCDYLYKKKYEITVIDNLSTGNLKNLSSVIKNINFIKADISKKDQLKDIYFKKIDSVFHFAALADIVPSINDPLSYFNANVLGTINILEKSRINKVKKFIYSASSSCYGLPDKLPINEYHKINPQYPYALTKYLGEELVLHWAKVYKMNNISLRFFNVYGPRSRTNSNYGAMFGVFLAQKLANKPLTIIGDGTQTRDFLFIHDLLDAIYKAWKNGKKGEVYNIASGSEISVLNIANILKHKIIFIPKRPGEPNRLLADIYKAKTHLNWKPKTKILDGINQMLRNISNWKKAPIWTPSKIKQQTKNWFKYLK